MKAIRKDQWLSLAITGVLVITFVFVIFLPQRRQLKTLKQERQAAAEALERDKTRATELAKIRGDVSRMAEQLGFFNRRLPDQQELGQFLRDVSGNARSAGLDSAAFQPQKTVHGELYVQMPITMKFKGHFAGLFKFLRQAKEMTRLTHVRSIIVRNDRELSGQCTVELEMSIYFTRG